ncbi:MAG: S9 family peptidase [Flammeovirgaceae bacterium]|nr:S9 family peptidase [Flammeovirgaceae bacterium]
MKKSIWILLILTGFIAQAQENIPYQRPPEEIARLLEAPLTPLVTFSPDKNWMVLLDRSDFPSIEELSRPELRIAGLRINPDNFGPSRTNFFIGIKLKSISDGKEYEVKGLPQPLQLSEFGFSPDSKNIAFLQSFADRIELWNIDIATFTAKKLTNKRINGTLGDGFSWLSNSQSLVFLTAVNEASKAPKESRIPTGPVIEENLGKKAASRTYQDLLDDAHDEALFEFYGTSQINQVSLSGQEKALGVPAIYSALNPSPDGNFILTENIHKPFSYLVPAGLFPQRVHVIDINGKDIKTLAEIPLADNLPLGFNATIKGPRNHNWRADQPATVYWVEAQDGGDPKSKAEIRDKIFESSAPFSSQARELISLPLRYAGISWGNESTAMVTEFWRSDRKIRTYEINPSSPGTKKVVFDRSMEDAYGNPGNVMTTTNQYGKSVMMINADNSVYLSGNGSSPKGDFPFVDKMDLKTGKKTRLWQCEAPYFERVITILDSKKGTFVTSRESLTDNPNYFVRSFSNKKITQLTNFEHPYPQIQDVKKQVLHYKRDDGVDLTADLYLPAGYKKEDGPLPTFLWAYPREFKSSDNAGQVTGSPYTFTRLSWGSAIYWVVRGYAILDNASIPIVGEGDAEPNDTYIKQLVSSAKAAIDYGASLGVVDPTRVAAGGHSYGAFMTANLLAHCDLFKAGIARSGAYNRTLTPFGFQAEERTYWQAPEVYFNMSPFSFADKIKTPILFTHGQADNNSGTFPVQTERMYNAVKGHGGITRYVLLPYESHGYRAKESVGHTLWEMDRWLEKYVKNANKPLDGTQ